MSRIYLGIFLLFGMMSGSANAMLILDVVDTASYGYRFNGVSENRDAADFVFEGQNVDVVLYVDGFDIDTTREVKVEVNGKSVGYLSRTLNSETGASIIVIPSSAQTGGDNTLRFSQISSGWTWGVTNVLLSLDTDLTGVNQLVIDQVDSGSYGYGYNGVTSNQSFAKFQFEGQSSDLVMTVDGFDIDSAAEITVLVNDQSVGNLSRTSNNLTGSSTLDIPVSLQRSGKNTLRFSQLLAGWTWGISNLLLSTEEPGIERQSLLLDQVDSSSYGYRFNGVTAHKDYVEFEFEAQSSDIALTVDGFDVDMTKEVQVEVNGQSVGYLSRTQNNQSGSSTFVIPPSAQVEDKNILRFSQLSSGWIWGVRNILLSLDTDLNELVLDQVDTGTYGYSYNGVSANRSYADFQFEGQLSDLVLTLDGFDIDIAAEVDVLVNGESIGNLSRTPDSLTAPSTLIIPASLQSSGKNTLRFAQIITGWKWGVSNLLLSLDDAQPENPFLVGYELVFNDEFSGWKLDSSKWDTSLIWGPYLPINNEEQLYVDTLGMHANFVHSPFSFSGDTMKITASSTSGSLQPPMRPPEDNAAWKPNSYSEYRFNGPYTDPDTGIEYPGYEPGSINYLSGIITSYGTFKMTHGYVETRAKLPAGRGLWPAFWLLPTHYVEDVPEIDVMEFLGQDVDRLYQTYHYFDIADGWRKVSTPSFPVYSTDWTQEFHTYGMAWGPTEIIWYVDGVETHRITEADYKISGQPMYLIANLAVGGNWPGTPDENTVFPAEFEIDYIRAYKRKLDPQLNLSADYKLRFEDNFNSTTLDADKWNTHLLWGPYQAINREEQYYVDALGSDNPNDTNTPFVMNNGILSITARTADDPDSYPIPRALPPVDDDIWTEFPSFRQNQEYTPGSYTSGIITSYDSFKFAYGYAEARARIPKGDGLWPAFWLLNSYYIGQQPEIDIMEVRGENPHEIVHSYHHGANGSLQSHSATTVNADPVIGYSGDFHTYGVRWQPGRIDWYIDGSIVHTYENEDVAYQLMYVIANLAVGGNFNFSAVDDSVLPASLDIDYIRVYQERHKD